MDFEYGCSTTNKFCFLDENEVEDPSDLLAQAQARDATKDTKTGKDGKAKPKSADPKAKTAGKDAKKQPLQQQTDNSVKKTGDLKTDAKKTTGQVKSAQVNQTPREDKENTSNRGPGQRTGDNRPRPPRPEGENTGYRGNQDGQRPPRRTGPRPEGQQGDQRGPRPDRPPRRPRPEGGFENAEAGQGATDDNVANMEGGEGGFRRPGGMSGGYRGARTGAGGERRGGGSYRGAPGSGGGFRQRRTNDPDHPREFDRHSGSEKTGIKAIDKKEGAGKGNWGTAADDLAAEGEVLNETQGEQTAENQNWAERVDESEEGKTEGVTDENAETHPNFMTLDEYKALRNAVNKRNDFNIRRPGEGEDLSKWGKTYVLPKKPADEEEDEEEEEEEENEEEEEDAEDEKKKQLLSQIQIKFYDSGADRRNERRPGGERRGGAGGPRGDRGDRQDRGDRGDRQDRGERVDRPPRRERPEAPVVTEPVPQPTPTTGEVAAPVVDAETSSPSGKPRFTRGPQQPQQQQRGNNNQRRGPREGPGGPSRVGQKAAPKFDDEKDFPSLGK